MQELVTNTGDWAICHRCFDLFMINKRHLLYPRTFLLKTHCVAAGGRMRGAVHSSLIFSLFLSFVIRRNYMPVRPCISFKLHTAKGFTCFWSDTFVGSHKTNGN